MINGLFLSNSTMPGTPFFTWPQPYVKKFLGDNQKELVFIPFAGVTITFDEYEQKVIEVFRQMGYQIKSIHRVDDPVKAIENAGAVVVGGGNTFSLLARMYQANIVDVIKKKVDEGTPYIGWSAGCNVGCATIMTTNDMPVVQPPSFNALGFLPFQVNPHYHELKFEGQGGETRRERLEEFLVMNPTRKVVGLPEGMFLHRSGDKLMLDGNGIAKLYVYGEPVQDVGAGRDLSFLLKG